MEGALVDGGGSKALDKEDTVALERVELSDEEDDQFDYGGVEVDEFSDEEAEEDEDLQTALRTMAVSESGDVLNGKQEVRAAVGGGRRGAATPLNVPPRPRRRRPKRASRRPRSNPR